MTARNRVGLICCGTIIAFCLSQASAASSYGCQDAISSYNSAVSDIASTLRRYTNCISNSNGRDDCSSEFRRIKNVQSDFEDAVSKYGMECN
jgi:hypothetical protein